MKTSSALPLLAFLIPGLFLCSPISAGEPTPEEAAEELLDLIGSEKQMRASFLAGMAPLFTKMRQSGASEEQVRQVEAAGLEMVDEVLADPEFRKTRLTAYTEVFSREELLGLVEFYRSPVGQKALVKMPEITRARAATVQEVMKRYQPQFNEAVGRIMAEGKTAPDPAAEE